jgi:hypothetical protein
MLRLRYLLVILGLVAAFYCLASILIERMPFTSETSWWMGIWPSRGVGVYVWFGLLNTVGALIAAVPVAILLIRLIDRDCVRAAFLVGAPTALVMIGSAIAHYSPLSRASAFIAIALFLAMLLAVPFLVWSMRALPSNNRFQRSRGPAHSASEGGDR